MTDAEAFQSLRRRANAGDPEAQGALVRFLKANPMVMKKLGDLAYRAENSIIEAATGNDFVTTQAIRHEAHELRKGLAGPNPTVLERMVADRVVSAWLLLQHVQIEAVQPHRERAWAVFWMKRLESAERMYRSALASLDLVREMLPAAAQPETPQSQPSPATAAPAASQPADGSPHEPPVLQFNGTNRISNLFADSGDGLMPDASHMEPANGHRHRLNGFLSPVFDG
jgi:hypothetical protein